MELFNISKALHLVFMVSWFAGLFYMVRLFIYFSETETETENKEVKSILKKQFQIMQKRLWYIISWPAMILTIIFGTIMLILEPGFLDNSYMHYKLSFVFVLVIYHLLCHVLFLQQQQNIVKFSSYQLRLWNEVATLLLVSIVFIIVLKNTLDWVYGIIGFSSIAILLMLGIRIYKKLRTKK